MKSTPKWLLIPPAVGLLLVLGPLSMQGGHRAQAATKAGTPTAEAPRSAAQEPEATDPVPPKSGRSLPSAPRTPDLWQMGSALIGVLLLGAGCILAVRKLRGGASPKPGAPLATLRQTLRLSPRQAIHAIEFDDRILLVGESERGLLLLESSRAPERLSDEAEVIARAHVPAARATDDDDDGAVPKNLVIPRPDQPVAARRPTPPAIKPTAGAANPGLGDFRALLQKAGRA